ncbi:MAG TPA: hypothetical protein VNS32_21245, partial [Flavisolibacter sp.]|nr:hypothetical protein [Flavisolibacter sp.]
MKKFLRFLFPAIFFSQFLSAQTQIIPFGATWKYLDNGSNQGTAWRNTTNASWETGQGLFGYGVKNIITQISEGVKKKDNYVTTYFTK